jgi:hypothetical protein
MLSELHHLFAATSRDATYDDYRCAIVDENVLGKRTMATRKESLRRLCELYGLSPELPPGEPVPIVPEYLGDLALLVRPVSASGRFADAR